MMRRLLPLAAITLLALIALSFIIAPDAIPIPAGTLPVAVVEGSAGRAPAATVITIQGDQRRQLIDGFGVNVNGASWDDGRLSPAIDTLDDTLGTTIWRVIVEEADWEKVNDNADPFSFNWDYYNSLYASGEFPSLWALIGYLNQRDAGQIILNVMGRAPDWMGRTVIDQAAEDEWVEMIASLVVYARETKQLHFDLLSPTNEVDIGAPEGPQLSPDQYARLLRKLTDRLDALGYGDISLVPPDIALVEQAPNYLPPLFADPVIMARVKHFSFHDYGGRSGEVPNLIAASAYPDRTYWMTEFSAGCPKCDEGSRHPDPWTFGFDTLNLLMQHLEQNASGAMVYEGFDSYYDHHGAFSHWGLLAYDEATSTYTTTSRLYLLAHVYRFVRPGMVRLAVSGAPDGLQAQAFLDPDTGELAVVLRNSGPDALSLQIDPSALTLPPSFAQYRTTQSEQLARLADLPTSAAGLSLELPAQSAVTLSSAPSEPPPSPTLLLGHNALAPTRDSNPAGTAEAFRAVASVSGTANCYSLYVDEGGGADPLVVGLYSEGPGEAPGSLLAQARIVAPQAGAWNTVALPEVTISAGTPYWLAALAPAGAEALFFRSTEGGGKAQTSAQTDLADLPGSWSPGATYASAPISAYVHRCEPAAPVPEPSVYCPLIVQLVVMVRSHHRREAAL